MFAEKAAQKQVSQQTPFWELSCIKLKLIVSHIYLLTSSLVTELQMGQYYSDAQDDVMTRLRYKLTNGHLEIQLVNLVVQLKQCGQIKDD